MIPQFDEKNISAIHRLLDSHARIVIIPHHKPDGDAIGASLALYNFFSKRNHLVHVISPSEYPDFLAWMPGNDQVLNFEKSNGECLQIIRDATVMFCIDFNNPDRVEKMQQALSESKAVKILIDHHLHPSDFCDYTFSFPDACASCELVYHFLIHLDGKNALDKTIAECLYTGIMTDTGSFRFSSMTADTHEVIASLIRAGARNYKIHELVFDNFSEIRTRFLGYCLMEKLVIVREFQTAYMALTARELKQFQHQTGDTEGIVNYGLAIKGIRLAALFTEQNNLIKISFRSHGNFSVKEIASAHFSGGGHLNAAGGRSTDSLEATIQKFLKVLHQYKDQLTS